MSAFGLDIGTKSIKAVQLAKSGDTYSLLSAGIIPSPVPGMTTESAKDQSLVAEAVKKLVLDARMTAKEVNISLPESKVFTRVIDLPPLTDEEVAAAISWQAEPYIPIPVAEAAIDYQIVSRKAAGQGTNGGVQVLLVAAPKKLVEKYVNVVQEVGLTVKTVQTELLALTSSLAPKQGTVLIVDLGASSTDLAVVRDAQVLATRSIATAGEALTRAVATALAVDMSQSEEYKKSYGLHPEQLEGKIRMALEPAFRVIVEEMKKIIQYYKTELQGKDGVSQVVLSGGTAGLPEMVSYLAQALGLEVVVGNPFAGISLSPQTAKSLGPFAPLYAVSVGLAKNI